MSQNDLILIWDDFNADVTEQMIVSALEERYAKQQIYTYLGDVLLVVNPYTQMLDAAKKSIYDVSCIDEYEGKEMHQTLPHPFSIAEAAYSHLMRHHQNQCLLITGESGSGKTETSKHIMHYIANVSTRRHRSRQASIAQRRMSAQQKNESTALVTHVRHVLSSSNPLLESFGNAKTLRNNNSSRFGKYMVLQLNLNGQVVGGFINQYLLEKSRVTHQSRAANERNFHVFYQLLCIESEDEKRKYGLRFGDQVSDFPFLASSNSVIEGVNDRAEFEVIKKSMLDAGIGQDLQIEVFRILSAILYLGRINFEDGTDDPQYQGCVIQKDSLEIVDHVSNLLGLSSEKLVKIITSRIFRAGLSNTNKTVHSVPLDVHQAENVCRSLARYLYGQLFDWLVRTINADIYRKPQKKKEEVNTIGILDIYGFEILEENRFEQLCINYVNEKLQQFFIMQTLQTEQKEYQKEAIQWTQIDYFDNQIVCELIEDAKLPGLFPLLDEQCAISQFSEAQLLNRYNHQYTGHAHYKKKLTSANQFILLHYAGSVEYSIEGFFEQNVDTLTTDSSSSTSQLNQIESYINTNKNGTTSGKRPASLSLQFREQMNQLILKLQDHNTQPHYVRCLKPNETKTPFRMQRKMVTQQIKYLGLLQNLQVKRQGFCYKETYPKFVHRFKMLSTNTWPNIDKTISLRDAAALILSSKEVFIACEKDEIDKASDGHVNVRQMINAINNKPKSDPKTKKMEGKLYFLENDTESCGCYALGKRKVFIRHPIGLFALEKLREQSMGKIVGILENGWKRFLMRCKIRKMQLAYTQLMESYDALWDNLQSRKKRTIGSKNVEKREILYKQWNHLAQKYLPTSGNRFDCQLAEEERAILVIYAQSFVRASIGLRHMARLKAAVAVFSSRWKGLSTRRRMSTKEYNQCYQAMLGVRTEFERFMGKKKRRKQSLDRTYIGDYLNTSQYDGFLKILQAKSQNMVYFASHVIKINQRHAFQVRTLVISNNCVFNLKGANLNKAKERRCLNVKDITKLSLSTFSDDFLIIHSNDQYDYLLQVAQKTEVVLILKERHESITGNPLKVQFENNVDYYAYPKQLYHVKFEEDKRKTSPSVVHTKENSRTLVLTVGQSTPTPIQPKH